MPLMMTCMCPCITYVVLARLIANSGIIIRVLANNSSQDSTGEDRPGQDTNLRLKWINSKICCLSLVAMDE